MITALQLIALKNALQPVMDAATTEADAALSLEAYDYAARMRHLLRALITACDEGIKNRGQKEEVPL